MKISMIVSQQTLWYWASTIFLWFIAACAVIGHPHLTQYWPNTGQPEQYFTQWCHKSPTLCVYWTITDIHIGLLFSQ